jgi:transcriptional regulator, putative
MIKKEFGRERAQKRWSIREELDARGLTLADVARLAGRHPSLVSATLQGFKHSPAILDALRKIGVPEEYLHDPRKEAAA